MPNIFFNQSLCLASIDHTKTLAEQLGRHLKNRDIITLEGHLGSGKTTFARFLIQSLVQKPIDVTSPTFNLVQIYDAPPYPIWHFDLYRLENEDELFETGFEEALSQGVLLIEWPCRAGSLLPLNHLNLKFSIEQDQHHHVKLTPSGTWKTRSFND